ncbi:MULTISPECIES: hypothetical protein [Achromobacter]|uniref:hypothetical protein n=1 Tax=Achromobacter TaxID=222 RepID=UPI000AB08EB7|nr:MULTISPECIES: hypothetical protein [Achromobacter]MEC6413534.1 hypothetical protein [Achromobacter xylosoxidans]
MTSSNIELAADFNRELGPHTFALDKLLVVAFPKSPSKNFPIALDIAKRATTYAKGYLGNTPMHLAAFDRTERDAKLAIALLDYAGTWKGTMLFAKGILVRHHFDISEVLRCFLEASQCTDFRAHCYTVIDDPDFASSRPISFGFSISMGRPRTRTVEVKRFSFPCSKLKHYVKLDSGHPSSYQNQIQAAAVKKGCALCPNFDASEFKPCGVVNYEIEA